jgi:hypothetical protein
MKGSFIEASAVMPVTVFDCTNKFENKKEEGLIKQTVLSVLKEFLNYPGINFSGII